jgi:acyl-CoA oxidase
VLKSKTGGGAKLFDVWMKQESDLIQATSKAYGERICMEQCLSEAEKASDRSLKYVVTTCLPFHHGRNACI